MEETSDKNLEEKSLEEDYKNKLLKYEKHKEKENERFKKFFELGPIIKRRVQGVSLPIVTWKKIMVISKNLKLRRSTIFERAIEVYIKEYEKQFEKITINDKSEFKRPSHWRKKNGSPTN